MLTLPIVAGRSYRTREGAKATVFKTDNRPQMSSDAHYTLAGFVEVVTDSGRVYDKPETWRTDGRYQSLTDRRDLVEDWVDPVFKYTPIFKNGVIKGHFDTLEEAIEYAGSHATADTPLLGFLRTDVASDQIEIVKTGQVVEEE